MPKGEARGEESKKYIQAEGGKMNGSEAGSKNEEEDAFDINVKPTVTNPKMKNVINDIYKGQESKTKIGSGTTMDAVRNELKTGKPTCGIFHSKKAREAVKRLKNLVSSGKLNDRKKKIARDLLDDISKALSGN